MLEKNEKIEVNGTEYTILKLLGKGKSGFSYLARTGDSEVVVKQIHHEPCAYYQFGDKLASERTDYSRLQKIGIPMPRMLDVDTENERIVKEYLPGDTVYELILKNQLPPFCLPQLQAMCHLLYEANTNIDYFPTNFIPYNDTLYYVDYECNNYMDEWNFENWGVKYWSKTPEFLEYAREHSTTLNFSAKIIQNGTMDAGYIIVPYDIKELFGKGRLLVHATFDGQPYDGQVVKMKTPYYLIGVTKAMRKQINKSFGDTIEVTIQER